MISHIGSGPWDQLISTAQPASLIVNATGLGKDRPGSPASRQVRFPASSVVWDLNYRGDLRFLDLAREHLMSNNSTFTTGGSCSATAGLQPSPSCSASPNADLGRRFLDVAHDLRPTRN